MASNALPDKRDRLFALGDDMCDGAPYTKWLSGSNKTRKPWCAPALDAALRGIHLRCLPGAEKNANAAHNTADNAAKVFITNAKKRLSKFFGEAYSTEWGAAGWPNNSTGMPSTQAERFSLINSLKLHFTANPAHESADMEVTAALATTLHTTISNARAALDQKVTESGRRKPPAMRPKQTSASASVA
ncbi:MAG: hypothetical protein IPK22_29165 [Verrucomicrobiaceae bacterium]|nr:hypothetical protein [Verrucomicrobiaceae bacterium]